MHIRPFQGQLYAGTMGMDEFESADAEGVEYD
jgi:hypothetical protein